MLVDSTHSKKLHNHNTLHQHVILRVVAMATDYKIHSDQIIN